MRFQKLPKLDSCCHSAASEQGKKRHVVYQMGNIQEQPKFWF